MRALSRISLGHQLTMVMLGISLLAISIGFVVVIFNDIKTFKEEMVSSSIVNAKLVGEYSVTPLTFDDQAGAEDILAKLQALPFVSNARLYDEQGKLFAVYNRPGEELISPPPIRSEQGSYFAQGYLHLFQPVSYRNRRYGTIYLRASTEYLDRKVRQYSLTMAGVIGGLVLFTWVLALRLQRVFSGPILRLAEVTRQISAAEDYSVRVPVQGENEIGVLYNGFNSMLEQIELRRRERDRAAQALKESEERYRTLFNRVPVGLFRSTPAGQILDANTALAQMLGCADREAVLALHTGDLYLDPAEQQRWLALMAAAGVVHDFEVRMRRLDGETIWVRKSGRAERDTSGQVLYFDGSLQDITQRKQAQADREALITELEAKNAELERFTYTVSHDLKGPLITIRGFLGYLEQDALAGDEEQMRVDLARIGEAAEKMDLLLQELLELSRIGRLVNEPVQVPATELVDEALRLLAGRIEQQGAVLEVAADLPMLYGDRPRLLELWENLIDNAIKFGGEEPNVVIGCRRQGNETIFSVQDSGIGIDPRYHERVFGLFEKLDHSSEGSGAGLAIVKRVVEVHEGRIWIESEGEGQGTTICFSLPAKGG